MANGQVEPTERKVIGKAVLAEGDEIVRHETYAPGLHAAIIRYLASDGSFGLYDAGTAIQSRDEMMQFISWKAIDAAQEAIRASKKQR